MLAFVVGQRDGDAAGDDEAPATGLAVVQLAVDDPQSGWLGHLVDQVAGDAPGSSAEGLHTVSSSRRSGC